MEIISVKTQGQGYLLNGTMSVPKADGNSEYELIKQWIAEGNEPEAEFTDAELLANDVEVKKQEALTYLKNTDWYVTRKIETGVEISFDVLTKRSEARLLI